MSKHYHNIELSPLNREQFNRYEARPADDGEHFEILDLDRGERLGWFDTQRAAEIAARECSDEHRTEIAAGR